MRVASQNDDGLSLFREMLKRANVNDKLARAIVDAGSAIKLGKEAPACDWDSVWDSFQNKGEVASEQVEQIKNFTVAVGSVQRELKKKVKNEEASKAEIRKLGEIDLYLLRIERLRESYKEVSTRTALQAVAGASFSPLATVAAYLAWNPANKNHTQELISQINGLDQNASPLQVEGNHVKPVPQEKLWQAKIHLLEEATALARTGKPVEIDVQYFEMTSSSFVGKLAEAAQAGCPVRINIDPSRPVSPSASEMSVDDGPRKLRALLQMASLPQTDVAVSVFPVASKLGSLTELMHRKLLRVGETVLLGGMNANEGSGENYDTGYVIEGPAASRLVEGFRADIQASQGATMQDVYGSNLVLNFFDKNVSLTPHGLATTFDALSGPSPAGTRISSSPKIEELRSGAESLGLKLGDLIAVPEEDLEKSLKRGSRQPVELTEAGKDLLGKLIVKVFERTLQPSNIEKLAEIQAPQGKEAGEVKMALGSAGVEREALVLQAISIAEKFLFAPTFVITKAVARALVARRDELAAQGKELDVRVVADAGMYGYGGTPNEEGVFALEDAGIPVRWSMLTRAEGDHDRKIHAKQILTEKMELIGSTNLSNKGIRDNWELSGLVYFDGAEEAREESKERFLKLWDHEAAALDSRTAAARLVEAQEGAPEKGSPEYEVAVEQMRRKAMQSFLGLISSYEVQSAKFIQTQMENPRIRERAQALQAEGMAYGYARLQACQEILGEKEFYAGLEALPSRVKLAELAPQ